MSKTQSTFALAIKTHNDVCIYSRILQERGCEKAFDDAFALQNPGYVLNAALWEALGGDEFFLGRAFDWTEACQGRDFWKQIDGEWERMQS